MRIGRRSPEPNDEDFLRPSAQLVAVLDTRERGRRALFFLARVGVILVTLCSGIAWISMSHESRYSKQSARQTIRDSAVPASEMADPPGQINVWAEMRARELWNALAR